MFLHYRGGLQNHYSIIGQGSLRITDLGEIDTGLYRVRASSLIDGSTLPKIARVTAQGIVYAKIGPQKHTFCFRPEFACVKIVKDICINELFNINNG